MDVDILFPTPTPHLKQPPHIYPSPITKPPSPYTSSHPSCLPTPTLTLPIFFTKTCYSSLFCLLFLTLKQTPPFHCMHPSNPNPSPPCTIPHSNWLYKHVFSFQTTFNKSPHFFYIYFCLMTTLPHISKLYISNLLYYPSLYTHYPSMLFCFPWAMWLLDPGYLSTHTHAGWLPQGISSKSFILLLVKKCLSLLPPYLKLQTSPKI